MLFVWRSCVPASGREDTIDGPTGILGPWALGMQKWIQALENLSTQGKMDIGTDTWTRTLDWTTEALIEGLRNGTER